MRYWPAPHVGSSKNSWNLLHPERGMASQDCDRAPHCLAGNQRAPGFHSRPRKCFPLVFRLCSGMSVCVGVGFVRHTWCPITESNNGLQNMMRRRNTQKFFVSIFVATREAKTFAVKGELPELTEIRHNFFESRRKGTAARRTGHDQSGGK